MKMICINKRVAHDYEVMEKMEAGLVLYGTEVKSLREGRVSLKESYATIKGGEVYLCDCNISAYPPAGPYNHEPKRDRKLLLHKQQIKRLIGKVKMKGFTIVPTCMYFKGDFAKVEIALVKGRKKQDKRELIKKRIHQREIERALKRAY
jgi:SsrA-binding protein